MDRSPQKILIVTGEASGDMRGASLVRAVKAIRPDTAFFGIGGDRCRHEGVETFMDITSLAVIGFSDVLKNLPRIKRVFNLTIKHAREERPALAILVDYPGFNLRLAKELKKLGIKVIYYVSPQIWAWKESRVKIIRQVTDRMMVLFPFEKELYARHGYAADFVGHPLVDEVKATLSRAAFLKSIGLDPEKPVLAFLPGSRENEISRLLGAMVSSAQIIQKKIPDLQVIILKAGMLAAGPFKDACSTIQTPARFSEDYYNALCACDAAVVCSGTATLECALMEKPMVVVYKTSWFTWFLGRWLVKIPYIALVNIVAGKKIVEELLQDNASPGNISHEAIKLLGMDDASPMRLALKRIRDLLGESGASDKAAGIIVNELKQ
jgi:lipid-A-disaccharide synthase